MQFALLIYHSPEEFAMRENDYNHPHLGAWRSYYKALVEAGVYLSGSALEAPETATTVRLREGKRRVQARVRHTSTSRRLRSSGFPPRNAPNSIGRPCGVPRS